MLLILASVAISLTIGSNGIFTRAQNAVERYEIASADEQNELNKVVNFIDDYINGNEYNTGTTVAEAKEQNKPYEKTTTIKDDNGKEVTIPKEFSVHPDSNTVVDEGIIITDGTNEFVWVPVDDPSTMFEEKTATLTEVTTTTTIYSKLRVRDGDSNRFTSGAPGNTDEAPDNTAVIREPDVLSEYDTDEEYYKNMLGFNTTKEMADSMVAEYKMMSDSVKKYHGFYIGRYELTGTLDNPTVREGKVLTDLQDEAGNWYGLYKACQNVIENNSEVKSTMIYGCEWDETCNWLSKNGYNVNDSSTWGNYNESPINTGSDPRYKANEIFDLAGNYWDLTQEALSTNMRVNRGGRYGVSGSIFPVSGRNGHYSNLNDGLNTARVTLYIM